MTSPEPQSPGPSPLPAGRPLHPWDELPRDGKPLKPAYVYAAERDWPNYFKTMANTPPRETLIDALDRFENSWGDLASTQPEPPHAIDLGCGEGRDTAELLRRGWRVTALDGHPEALERIDARPDLVHRERLTLVRSLLEEAQLVPALLVNSSFTLPFCLPGAFDTLWTAIVAALPRGGRFAGQFFGDRDTWASLPDRTHHTRAQAEALLAPFEVESLLEEEKPSKDQVRFPKHWHVFHIVARKR